MVLAVLLLGVGSTLSAQREDFLNRSELLLMGGGMNYIGDLNDESALTLPRLAAGPCPPGNTTTPRLRDS